MILTANHVSFYFSGGKLFEPKSAEEVTLIYKHFNHTGMLINAPIITYIIQTSMKARVELKTELDVKSPVFDAKFKGHFLSLMVCSDL